MLRVEETAEREMVRVLAIDGVRSRVKVRQQGRHEGMGGGRYLQDWRTADPVIVED